ncbi:MAG: hypothetical protein KIS86_13045 [Devosia sp.]|nr:hypothetical protein [Devosia sp.]
MTDFNIDNEREQLVATWNSAFETAWMTKPRACVLTLIDPSATSFGMPFRQTHNIFGWMAGNTLERRGLCSGAIYRSERFMSLPLSQRNGSAGPRKTLAHLQNIHIEHTVPIKTLALRWSAYRQDRAPDVLDAYAWMLIHSVSSAVHMAEKGGLGRYEQNTDAFDTQSMHYGLPFMRYTHMKSPPRIWNVLSGDIVDPQRWTFTDHFETVDRLIALACADEAAGLQLRGRGQSMMSAAA